MRIIKCCTLTRRTARRHPINATMGKLVYLVNTHKELSATIQDVLHRLPIRQVWNLNGACWRSTVCITWHPVDRLCVSWSLRTLAVVTYAQLRVAILPFQSQRTVRYGPGSFAVAGPSTWNSLPLPLRSRHLPSLFRRTLNTNCSPERVINTLMTVCNCKSGRTLTLSTHHHHQHHYLR